MIGQGELLIERYLIVKQLGAGGFSKTYLVRDKYLPGNPQCIVKQLYFEGHNTLTVDDARTLFEREATILYTLGHAHNKIPGLLAYVKDEEHPCLVEEYIEGENLESYILEGKQLKPKEAIALLRDVLSTLIFINEKNIIHQDIKPSNLIRRESDKVVALIDFGAAIHPNEPPFKDLTFGTPGYVPQEQRAGESVFASDLYALGITTVQLLTGVHPQQLKRDPMTNEIDWQSHLKSHSMPVQLKEVLTRLTRTNAAERYKTVKEALTALNQSQPLGLKLSKRSESSRDTPDLESERAQRPRQFPWKLTAVGSILLATGTAIMLSQPGSPFHSLKNMVANQTGLLQAKNKSQLQLVRKIRSDRPIDQILITSDRLLVTVDNANTVKVTSIETGQTTAELKKAPAQLTKLVISPDGQWLFGTSNNREVAIWNLLSGKLARSFTMKDSAIQEAVFSPDSRAIATSTANHQMQLWDVSSGRMVRSMDERMGATNSNGWDINRMFFAPDNTLICATKNNRMMIWDTQTGTLKRILLGHTNPVDTMQVSQDGEILYSFGKDRAIAWDVNNNKILKVLPSESAGAIEVRWLGTHLLTLHEDGHIRLWDPQSGRLMETLNSVHGKTVVSPNAQYIANAVNQEINIWKLTPAENANDVPNF